MPDKKAEQRLRARLLVKPGTRVKMTEFDPDATFGHRKESAQEAIAGDIERLDSLQERIYAESKHPVLIMFQGIDASGKDGAIRHLMGGFDPMGCVVTGFKVPTPVEAAHDFLWRVHQRTPARGEIAIFNRTAYEEVLVVRVHDLVPKAVWSKRYDQINAWERILVDEGTTILKFFLHIDAEEQRQRLQDRIDTPSKRWKFKSADLGERKLWDQYHEAYEDVLSRCSTEWAPWYVIPANRNWFRDLAVGEIVADTLDDLKPAYPPGEPGIETIKVV